MNKLCRTCQGEFTISDADLTFYKEIGLTFANKQYEIPPPTLCPTCRLQRRLAFRNERQLYKRKSDLSGNTIISNFSDDKPFKVYANQEYWSDKWNALSYGRDVDFTKPFFPQLLDLIRTVPHAALETSPDNEEHNCRYVNYAGNNKDCHMIFDSDYNQNCYYSSALKHSRECSECSYVDTSELCLECIDCTKCYNLLYGQNCMSCHDSVFLKNCIGCSDCLLCCNQTRKSYCIRNKQYSKEEYQQIKASMNLDSREELAALHHEFANLVQKSPQRFAQLYKTENSTGNYIANSKNCSDCFNISEGEDLRYCDSLFHMAKDCMDVSSFGEKIEKVYESGTIGRNCQNILFSFTLVDGCSDSLYLYNCVGAKNCLGCVSLNHGQYCILNKQYSAEEYESLAGKIIEHMQDTGEWGEHFPISLTRFAYNETVAQEFFPLDREVAIHLGYQWREDPQRDFQSQSYKVPSSIHEVSKDVVEAVLACTDCDKNYKISQQELLLYKKLETPLPTNCGDCRHAARIRKRNVMSTWERKCNQCGESVKSSYAPQRPEEIFCERCFQEELV